MRAVENLNLRTLDYKGNTFEFYEDCVLFNNKPCRIIENHKYSFKINKESISAIDGAYGLWSFMERCIVSEFGLCWIDWIVKGMKKMTDNCRELKSGSYIMVNW